MSMYERALVSPWITEDVMLGKIEGKRRKGWQRMRWLDSTADSMDMNLSTFWKILKDRSPVYCSPWDHKELDTT